MSTELHGQSPYQFLRHSWPESFTKRQLFDCPKENQPYLQILHDDDDFSDEFEGGTDTDGEQSEILNQTWNNYNTEEYTRQNIVRLFMKGMVREEEDLECLDQVEVVAGFCEKTKFQSLEINTEQDVKRVALLDDRCNGATTANIRKGHCRPYSGPLTTRELYQALSRKPFTVDSEQTGSSNVFEHKESDARRRLIYITDLDPSCIAALAATASSSQASALRDTIYKNLMGKASIGATISTKGIPLFTFALNIPYYALRQSKNVLKDCRKKFDGTPLRQSCNLPSLSMEACTPASTDRTHTLYEAQISISVTGIDNWVWTAYGFVDSYFDSNETVDSYHQLSTRGPLQGRVDPLAAGLLNADEPIWTPREYFFKVFAIRMNRVLKEWSLIVEEVDKRVEQSRAFQLPISFDDPKARQKIRDFSMWNRQMLKLLIQLVGRLSDTTSAWEEFFGKEIGYFLDNESPSLKLSIAAVDKAVTQMRGFILKLQRLEKELCQDNQQALHAQSIFQNSEAVIYQRKTTSYVQMLTVVTILFSPPAFAASLFNTHGILPFDPSLTHFTYVLLILVVLVAATLLLIINWTSWLHSIDVAAQSSRKVFKLLSQAKKSNEISEKGPGGEEIRETKAAWALDIVLALKRTLLPRKHNRSDPRYCLDLEMGCREPFMGSHRAESVPGPPDPPSTSSLEHIPDPLSSLMGWDAPSHAPKMSTSAAILESPGCPGRQFRLSEMDEDLLHPARYKAKLTELQAYVCRESRIAAQGLNIGKRGTKSNLTPASLLQECQTFLTSILRNVAVLREAGFCSSTATFLRIDPNRTQVAFLESIELDKVTQLEDWIDETKTSLENLRQLDSACKDLLGDYFVSPAPPAAGNIALASLRLFDLFLVSHACSHIGDIDCLMRKDTCTGRRFQISSQASSIIDSSAPSEPGTMIFSRRTLKCLNGFLCGEQVWVLHGHNVNPMDSAELFLSTTPNTFAEVWGPMWMITKQGEPMEILRYDLDHGSVVPFSSISGSGGHSIRTEPNEELCHWIPNSELESCERALASTFPPQISHPRLLIGACRHSVIPNTEKCYCNLTDLNKEFVSKGYRRPIGSSSARWATDSRTVGTTAGGAGLGAPAFQYSQTMKKEGIPAKEAFHKRWKNNPPQLRPWRYLLRRHGLQVSVCTRNSRRVRLVDLIAGDTMKEFMRSNPSYASEPWKEAFEEILHTDPARLITFQADSPAEREGFEKYITDCLDGLIRTGIGSRAKDPFVALWVYNGQPWEIAFPRQYYTWTGFVEDSDSMCSFVVLEKCLVNALGLKCCHLQEDMAEEEVQRVRKDTSAVLETFLTINDRSELPDGLRLVLRSNGRLHWSVGELWRRKHRIKLGKLGKLEGEGFYSRRIRKDGERCYFKRVLTGKWSSESPIAATARLLSGYITTPETHTEHICDDPDSELSPLPYFILEET